jgi:hypothetical protein
MWYYRRCPHVYLSTHNTPYLRTVIACLTSICTTNAVERILGPHLSFVKFLDTVWVLFVESKRRDKELPPKHCFRSSTKSAWVRSINEFIAIVVFKLLSQTRKFIQGILSQL